MVGYYCGFVLQKGMEDRLTRLERAVSYLESFLDVLKRCEILDKDTELQYDAYLPMVLCIDVRRSTRSWMQVLFVTRRFDV